MQHFMARSMQHGVARSALHMRQLAHAGPASLSWDAPPVVIVGGGIAGLSAALACTRLGLPVRVLEAAKDGLRDGEGAAIGVWPNAWRALQELGVADELRPHYGHLDRIELVSSSGRTLKGFNFDECDAGKDGACEFRGVRRGHLLRALAAALPPGTITLNARVARVVGLGQGLPAPPGPPGAPPAPSGQPPAAPAAWAAVELEGGGRVEAGVVVAGDGVNSRVAQALQLRAPKYAGYVAYRGMASPPGGPAALGLPPNTGRQVWGRGVRAGLYPLDDKEVYWFTCFNAPEGLSAPATPDARAADALSHVAGWSWGVEDAIRATPPGAISRSRIRDRWTFGAFGKGLVTAAGDAAHPSTPNLGQGGCLALEDSIVLARTLAACARQQGAAGGLADSLAAALRQYEAQRVKRCLPLTVRANLIGAFLQLPHEPVCTLRDAAVSALFNPRGFLDHTTFDVGRLA